MPNEAGSIQYSLWEPFDSAVESVCKSLAARGLRVAGKLDVSGRVKRSVGIVLPPCKIIFVLPGQAVLSQAIINPGAASFLPLNIVISANGAQTEVVVQNKILCGPEQESPALVAPILETQVRIFDAIQAIAMPSLV